MSRWLLPFRRMASGELEIFSIVRKHPILIACLSSGIIYRGYMAFPYTNSCNVILKNLPFGNKIKPKHLFSDPCNARPPSTDSRMHKLLSLHNAVETELPQFFEKGFLTVPDNLMDPHTVVYFERKSGIVHEIRNRTWINASVIGARAYFIMKSYARRLELTSILCDTEKWELEVSFRIVLLPSPSLAESRLTNDQLWQRLERRARWHDFRATFHLNENGQISSVKLTQFMPPHKSKSTLQNLQRLSLIKNLTPHPHRLPSPTPFVSWDPNTVKPIIMLTKPTINQSIASIPIPTQTDLVSSWQDHQCSVYDRITSLPSLLPEPISENSCYSSIESLLLSIRPNTIQLPVALIQPPNKPKQISMIADRFPLMPHETISPGKVENSIFPYFKSNLLDGSFLSDFGFALPNNSLFHSHPKIMPT